MSTKIITVAKNDFFVKTLTVNFNESAIYDIGEFFMNFCSWSLRLVRTVNNTFQVLLRLDKYNFEVKCINVNCYIIAEWKQKGDCIFYKNRKNKMFRFYWRLDTIIYESSSMINIIDFDFKLKGTLELKDIDIESEPFPSDIKAIPEEVLKNFESLLLNQKFYDVKLLTSNGSIPAHKIILAAQSPVFERMFSSEMKEKKDGITINVGDTEEIVLKEMLRFMYSGRVENIDNIAHKLLALANKYEIKPLLTLCEKALYDKLTIDNALSTIKIADLHNAQNLRPLIETFIIQNKNELIDTAEFKSLMISNPEIVIDILKATLK